MADKKNGNGKPPEEGPAEKLPEITGVEDSFTIQYVTLSKDDLGVVYIFLPGHPSEVTPGCVDKMIRLDQVLSEYDLPMINLDFDKNKKLIGIEVIV